MSYTIEQIAAALGTQAVGDTGIEIDSLAEPTDAGPRHLALAMKPQFAESLKDGGARASRSASPGSARTPRRLCLSEMSAQNLCSKDRRSAVWPEGRDARRIFAQSGRRCGAGQRWRRE